jgi:hypothetical protein
MFSFCLSSKAMCVVIDCRSKNLVAVLRRLGSTGLMDCREPLKSHTYTRAVGIHLPKSSTLNIKTIFPTRFSQTLRKKRKQLATHVECKIAIA